jgi:hypothetical protein
MAQIEEVDGSAAIFTMYLEMSLKEDVEMVEGWKEDANSILIFVSISLFLPVRHLLISAEWIVLCHGCGGFRTKLTGY